MRFIVTRPEEDARPLADVLAAAGHEVLLAPLLTIVPRRAEIPHRTYQAVLVTSANGVRDLRANPGCDRLLQVMVFAVGPASARAAREVGFGNIAVAGGDVTALVAMVKARLDRAGGPLLYLSGETVTGSLEGSLAKAGYTVDRVVLYEARPASTLPVAVIDVVNAESVEGVLLFSPRTAEIWARLVRDARLEQKIAKLRHLCLSAAVAERLKATLSLAPVTIAERPDEAAMVALALGHR